MIMEKLDHLKDRFTASLIGGAIGDALGYTVEFMGRIEILSQFGAGGITDLVPDKRTGKALVSDDTQMTLFTADGLIWAAHRGRGRDRDTSRNVYPYSSGLYPAYMRWYYTQQGIVSSKREEVWLERQPHEEDFCLLDQVELFARRAPGNTCLTTLASGTMGTIEKPLNESKGCGGVMRVAPIGLFFHDDPARAFQVGAEAAAITHGHPTGYLTAGAFAAIIAELVSGKELSEGVETALWLLRDYRQHEETSRALERAVGFARSTERAEEVIPELGEGWVAEETLAIAVYCAMKRREFRGSVTLAVNHSGDSDSTGAICGNLLGAYGGMKVIPADWAERIELREITETMAVRLAKTAVKQ
jgi:ADP-ribosylglycohydrolase